ncbi:hypothetical protein AMJ48_00405 [Parcubacteria bacterium DG_74_1]|nr:MAG: hypothetical protein AMJ48_00405 [Parcubacteria bacterium DG_74_1]
MLYLSLNQKGFVALAVTLLVLAIMFLIAMPLIVLILGQQRIASNLTQSNQAYFAAEAGIEDALLRLKETMQRSSPYSFSVGNATVEIIISDIIAWTRTVTATGNAAGRFRKVQVAYELSGLAPGLHYGAQVGDGGLIMDGNSEVVGNVFSNGSVNLKQPESEILETVVVAGDDNKIYGKGTVWGNAYADICEGESSGQKITVAGELYANDVTNCTSTILSNLDPLIDAVPLPIATSQIEDWENEAADGGATGTYSITSGSDSLGPIKIDGDLEVDGAELIITGTIWVTGDITIRNPSTLVHLAPSYESASGVIIGDNLINLQEGSVSSGSGEPGSYLMYISTSAANPAITIENATVADILYSNTGWISISQTGNMRSVNAYGINVANNSALIYEIGIESAFFTSGPAGGWMVTSWREIE